MLGGLDHVLDISKHFLFQCVFNDVETFAHQKLELKVDTFFLFKRHFVVLLIYVSVNAAITRKVRFGLAGIE
jgi:hypothetical protein